jgi:hypothetical protein
MFQSNVRLSLTILKFKQNSLNLVEYYYLKYIDLSSLIKFWLSLAQIRMSALSLLAESHCSTETFSAAELQLIKTFLEYNVNSEVPSSRKQALALLKKVQLLAI